MNYQRIKFLGFVGAVLLLAFFFPATSFAAVDMFLKIEDIAGESTETQVSQVYFTIATPFDPASGLAMSETKLHSPISVLKNADAASRLLYLYYVNGTAFNAQLVYRQTVTGRQLPYYTIELNNAVISGMTQEKGEDGVLMENITFSYAKLRVSY